MNVGRQIVMRLIKDTVRLLLSLLVVGFIFPHYLCALDDKEQAPQELSAEEQRVFQAARENDVQTIERLRSEGVNLEARDNLGQTPFIEAAKYGSVDALIALERAGVDIHVTDSFEANALHHAALSNQPESVRVLKELEFDTKSIRATDIGGQTALHLAAQYDSDKVIEPLIDLGVPKEAMDNDRRTALDIAEQKNHSRSKRILKEQGAISKNERKSQKDPWQENIAEHDLELECYGR